MSAPRLLLALSAAAAAAGALLLAGQKAAATAEATTQAVAQGGRFQARLTGYWPVAASGSAAEKRMEGGANDRKGHPLHTLEEAQAGSAPYVDVSGDDAIFPYGQRIELDAWPGVVFRVTDTGGHFRGKEKRYRVMGKEPLDVRVASKKTRVVPESGGRIVKGDHFDRPGKEIAVNKLQGQEVSVGWIDDLELLGAEVLL